MGTQEVFDFGGFVRIHGRVSLVVPEGHVRTRRERTLRHSISPFCNKWKGALRLEILLLHRVTRVGHLTRRGQSVVAACFVQCLVHTAWSQSATRDLNAVVPVGRQALEQYSAAGRASAAVVDFSPQVQHGLTIGSSPFFCISPLSLAGCLVLVPRWKLLRCRRCRFSDAFFSTPRALLPCSSCENDANAACQAWKVARV